MTEISANARRLLCRYAPEIAEKPREKFSEDDFDRLDQILIYISRRSQELSGARARVALVEDQYGDNSAEARAASEKVTREFADDMEAIINAPWGEELTVLRRADRLCSDFEGDGLTAENVAMILDAAHRIIRARQRGIN
jgi:hypothetical protein